MKRSSESVQYCIETILLQKTFLNESLKNQNKYLKAVVCKMQELIQLMSG